MAKEVKREVKLSAQDIKYFNSILDSMRELERNIAALEIQKLKLVQSYYDLEDRYSEFAKQIRLKYDIQASDAEVDLDKGIITYTVVDEEKKEEQEEK